MSKLCERLWNKSTSVQEVNHKYTENQQAIFDLLEQLELRMNQVENSHDRTVALCAYSEMHYYITNAIKIEQELEIDNDREENI